MQILKTLRKQWKFPKFGISPNETPISSPHPVEEKPVEIKKGPEVVQVKPTNKLSLDIMKQQLPKRKLEEEKPKLNKSVRIGDPVRIVTTSAVQNTVKQIEADLYEPFKNQVRAAPPILSEESNIKKANINKRPNGSSKNKKITSKQEKTTNLSQSDILNKNKSKNFPNIESRSELNSQTEERKRVNSIDSKFDSSKETNPLKVENYPRLQKISSASSKRSSKSTKSNLTSVTSIMNSIQKKANKQSQSTKSIDETNKIKKETQKQATQEIEKNNEEENTENLIDINQDTNSKQLVKKQNNKVKLVSIYKNNLNIENDNDMDDTEKAKHLFEFLYGFKGLPPRIRSSTLRKEIEPSQSYFNPENSIKNTATTTDDECNFYDSTYLRRQDELRPLSRNFTFDNPYLFEWLSLYEKRSKSMHERLNRVKENNFKIQTENQNIWSAAIERKKSAVEAFDKKKNQYRLQLPMSASSSSSDRSSSSALTNKPSIEIVKKNVKLIDINNRMSKSAYNKVLDKNNNSDKRPKTVSFSLNNFKEKEKTTELTDLSKETKSIIRLNEAYLVSQIEMEEILKEAEKRFLDQKNNIRKHSKTSYEFESSLNSNNKLNSCTDLSTKIETDDEDYNDWSELFVNLYNKNQRNVKTPNEAASSTNTSNNQRVKTAHRLKKLKKLETDIKQINWDKIPEFSDSNEEDSSDHEQNKSNKKQAKLQLNRLRTPNSIPSKYQKYILVEMPQINLEYSLPSSTERCLLNIRFPKFYKKIITSLTKLDQSLLNSKSIKRLNSANVEPV